MRDRAPVLPKPFLFLLLLAALALPGAAHASVGVSFVPSRVFQGHQAAMSVSVRPRGAACALAVRYADGRQQAGLGSVRAANGRAQWAWTVPADAGTGAARATVSCGRAGRVVRLITIVGQSVAPKLVVEKQGFSQRPNDYGSGSSISYGLQIANPSRERDAFDVTVLVNLVDAGNAVIASQSSRIDAIAAGTTFNFGGSNNLQTSATVAKLEAVVQVDKWGQGALHAPATANVRIVPSMFQPGWVGSVDGEVINDHPSWELTNAQLSIVLFDSAGNIVGGGTGYAFAALPPGTRVFWSSMGEGAVAMSRAASAHVSVSPSYKRS